MAALLTVLVATGATVAAVAGPAPERPVGGVVAPLTETEPGPTTTVSGAATTVAPATVVPVPGRTEGADNADIAPTDCSDADMCGQITPSDDCEDVAMCGAIRSDGECVDGEMCGDIPTPGTCADPSMCGSIVPEPDPGAG